MVGVERVDRWLKEVETYEKKVQALHQEFHYLLDYIALSRDLLSNDEGERPIAVEAPRIRRKGVPSMTRATRPSRRKDDDSIYIGLQDSTKPSKEFLCYLMSCCHSANFKEEWLKDVRDDDYYKLEDQVMKLRKSFSGGRKELLEGKTPPPPTPIHPFNVLKPSVTRSQDDWDESRNDIHDDVSILDESVARHDEDGEEMDDFKAGPTSWCVDYQADMDGDSASGDEPWLEQTMSTEEERQITLSTRSRCSAAEGKPPAGTTSVEEYASDTTRRTVDHDDIELVLEGASVDGESDVLSLEFSFKGNLMHSFNSFWSVFSAGDEEDEPNSDRTWKQQSVMRWGNKLVT